MRWMDATDYLTSALSGAWPWLPAAAAIYLFGQAEPAPNTGTGIPGFNIDFGSLSATAILGWYAWHNTTYTIPSIVKEFREELQTERKSNDEMNRELRGQFFQELREARDHYKSPPER
jgi:hypothetical protein